jgi:hypothetical protein
VTDDDTLNTWWASLTTEQQAEALTIPQKLPEWMADSLKASQILVNWQFGDQPPDEFKSVPLVKFLEGKRDS